MGDQRSKTVRYLAILAGLAFLLLIGLLAIELDAVRRGGNSTISELAWLLWAGQPWIVFITTHTVAAPFWFLMGHFFGQSRGVYDQVRQRATAPSSMKREDFDSYTTVRRGGPVAIAALLLTLPGGAAAAEPAAPIRSSIDGAVDKTLARASCYGVEEPEDCQLPDDDPVRQAARIAELEAKVKRVEEVADATSTCVRAAFVYAGADLVSTSAALKWCPECQEANPAGFSPEARIGLKLGILGAQIDQCYRAAKKGKKEASLVTWLLRIVQGAAVLNNTISAVRGEPLMRWGAPSEGK